MVSTYAFITDILLEHYVKLKSQKKTHATGTVLFSINCVLTIKA